MLTEILRGILSKIEDPIIFELGAFDCDNTQQLVMACEKGNPQIYSFEPDPRNFARCWPKLPATVNFFTAAIGNVTGKAPFHLSSPDPKGDTASSSISPFKDHIKAFDWCYEIGTVEVSCWRLDDFCTEHKINYIDLIFMDIQGAERLMIEGAQNILKHTKYVFTEYEGLTRANEGTLYEHSSSLERILELLPPGWTAIDILPMDALLKNNHLV